MRSSDWSSDVCSSDLLLARNPKALARFSRAFEDRAVSKSYLGLVAGELSEKEGRIELALSKISSKDAGWRMIPAKKGKPSITDWHRLWVGEGFLLAPFRPVNGPTQQIRGPDAGELGFPPVGVPVYGQAGIG